MAVTPARKVTSGYYRVHLLVVMGLMTLAALVEFASRGSSFVYAPAIAATLSYVGSVAWLYEKKKLGVALLYLVSGLALYGGLISGPGQLTPGDFPAAAVALRWLSMPTGGMLLGVTMAAMLLGHWYLNTPTMELAPLRRLTLLLGAATVLRILVSGIALGFELSAMDPTLPAGGMFWAMRKD